MSSFLTTWDTVLYQFLETGTLDKTIIGHNRRLKCLDFSICPRSFYSNSHFNLYRFFKKKLKFKKKREIKINFLSPILKSCSKLYKQKFCQLVLFHEIKYTIIKIEKKRIYDYKY